MQLRLFHSISFVSHFVIEQARNYIAIRQINNVSYLERDLYMYSFIFWQYPNLSFYEKAKIFKMIVIKI